MILAFSCFDDSWQRSQARFLTLSIHLLITKYREAGNSRLPDRNLLMTSVSFRSLKLSAYVVLG